MKEKESWRRPTLNSKQRRSQRVNTPVSFLRSHDNSQILKERNLGEGLSKFKTTEKATGKYFNTCSKKSWQFKDIKEKEYWKKSALEFKTTD